MPGAVIEFLSRRTTAEFAAHIGIADPGWQVGSQRGAIELRKHARCRLTPDIDQSADSMPLQHHPQLIGRMVRMPYGEQRLVDGPQHTLVA